MDPDATLDQQQPASLSLDMPDDAAPSAPPEDLSPIDFFFNQLAIAGLPLRDIIKQRAHGSASSSSSSSSSSSLSSYMFPLSDPGWLKICLDRQINRFNTNEVERMLRGIREATNEMEMFIYMIVPTCAPNTASASSSSSSYPSIQTQQDSLMRLLLLIEPLQTSLVKLLLKKLETITEKEGNKSGSREKDENKRTQGPLAHRVHSCPFNSLLLTYATRTHFVLVCHTQVFSSSLSDSVSVALPRSGI